VLIACLLSCSSFAFNCSVMRSRRRCISAMKANSSN
jgi:hypothetical protein